MSAPEAGPAGEPLAGAARLYLALLPVGYLVVVPLWAGPWGPQPLWRAGACWPRGWSRREPRGSAEPNAPALPSSA